MNPIGAFAIYVRINIHERVRQTFESDALPKV